MSGDRPLKIFLSSGSTYTDQQRKFVDAFENFLRGNGCEPRTVGQTVHSARQPVLAARQEIQSCDAAVVLAFTRYEVEKGMEFPSSKKAEPIDGMRLPTIWNQLEGGMAYGLDLPLLILAEKGLKRQGILSDRTEWFPQKIELSVSLLKEKSFLGLFEDWKKHARARSLKNEETNKTIAGMTMAELVLAIGWPTGLRIILALGSLVGASLGAGVWIGSTFG